MRPMKKDTELRRQMANFLETLGATQKDLIESADISKSQLQEILNVPEARTMRLWLKFLRGIGEGVRLQVRYQDETILDLTDLLP